jgi:transposase
MFERRRSTAEQKELWIVAGDLPEATPDGFYRRVNRTLEDLGFAQEVWAICTPAYAEESRAGRPGVDPVVYLKMLMVGFFEDLGSERAIASRCADSLSIRGFLGYALTEATPDHSTLSVIRERLSFEQLEAIHGVLLRALRRHGLLKGRKLGIDSSVMEANASLRALQHRNTEENYWDYVRKLAAENGIDPQDAKAVRRFDKKRSGRKTSNEEWVNPHDPEAKVGKTKDGATDMTYRPEHVTDLESGAIISTQVRPGDAADCVGVTERVMAAVGTLAQAVPEVPLERFCQELAADEGYFAIEEITQLHECGVRTVIADPHASQRRVDKASEEHRSALRRASRALSSKSGKALLRKRGEHLERSFCHVLDHGGLRRTTLRGCEKLSKRHLVAATTFNLSLLLRHLFGVGTPKQALARAVSALGWLYTAALAFIRRLIESIAAAFTLSTVPSSTPAIALRTSSAISRITNRSTGC